MEQWLAEIILGVIMSCAFPLIWKTNTLLTKMLEKDEQMHLLLQESIKALRHNEKEHMELVHALQDLKRDLTHEIHSTRRMSS